MDDYYHCNDCGNDVYKMVGNNKMTKEEAIKTWVDYTAYSKTNAEQLINAFEALGLIKFEDKPIEQVIYNAGYNIGVIKALDNAGYKIVRKDESRKE